MPGRSLAIKRNRILFLRVWSITLSEEQLAREEELPEELPFLDFFLSFLLFFSLRRLSLRSARWTAMAWVLNASAHAICSASHVCTSVLENRGHVDPKIPGLRSGRS